MVLKPVIDNMELEEILIMKHEDGKVFARINHRLLRKSEVLQIQCDNKIFDVKTFLTYIVKNQESIYNLTKYYLSANSNILCFQLKPTTVIDLEVRKCLKIRKVEYKNTCMAVKDLCDYYIVTESFGTKYWTEYFCDCMDDNLPSVFWLRNRDDRNKYSYEIAIVDMKRLSSMLVKFRFIRGY